MKASIIIPTRNRAKLLANCLESLTRQSFPPDEFEVLVVDNGSTDSTSDVAKHYAASLPLRIFAVPRPGLHAGRHAGMEHARSNILMFADDDIEAAPTWVEAVTEAFEDPAVSLVGGNNYPIFESPPPDWLSDLWRRDVDGRRAVSYLSVCDYGDGKFAIPADHVWGCNFSVRKSVLRATHGFHPDALPPNLVRFRGDGETHVTNWVRMSGAKTIFDSRASVHHWVPVSRMTRDYLWQRYYAQGISDSYSEIRKNDGPLGAVQALRRYFIFSRKIAQHKAHEYLERIAGRPGAAHRIQMTTTLARYSGYRFHQEQVDADPDLLAWVLRADYLNEDARDETNR
jgi:glycosyltransferase involved in cell wall biosynthesis